MVKPPLDVPLIMLKYTEKEHRDARRPFCRDLLAFLAARWLCWRKQPCITQQARLEQRTPRHAGTPPAVPFETS